MSAAIEQLGRAIEEALDEAPLSDVLSILTSAFVGVTLAVCKQQGHDTNLPIKIDGGEQRDVTIHPPKEPDHA